MPTMPFANSTVIVLPSTIIPAAASRRVTSLSVVFGAVSKVREPAVVGSPTTSKRSFTA